MTKKIILLQFTSREYTKQNHHNHIIPYAKKKHKKKQTKNPLPDHVRNIRTDDSAPPPQTVIRSIRLRLSHPDDSRNFPSKVPRTIVPHKANPVPFVVPFVRRYPLVPGDPTPALLDVFFAGMFTELN